MKTIYTLTVALLMACAAWAQEKPQILNGDFEEWAEADAQLKYAPDAWNSFEFADGPMASMVKAKQVEKSTDVRPGSTGKYSAKVFSRTIKVLFVSVAAQGNLTTGRIYAGAANTSSSDNYNYSDVERPGEYSCQLGAKPDSIAFWTKFVPGQAGLEAKFSAIIHDRYNYISYGVENPKDTENPQHVVSEAVQFIPATNGEWVRYCLPFNYEGPATDPEFILINVSTNGIPGKGTGNDVIYIDDIELIYNPTGEGGEGDNPTSGVKGDVNGDGIVTIDDITELINLYLNEGK